ncbi:hypothetical protein B0A55_13421 [Friedmanniomyces simplex]|uniref:Uncharacterized protein n=1 Tax=Friedmanniomyces simplex TaxID=329884 RepID=A0A4U0VKY7_9PEZI|nr:hypothetical protein B0A55_13421 [Friedmanniomyces simplex]
MGEEEDEVVSEDEDEVTGKSRDAGAGEDVGPEKDGADDVEEQITTSATASTDPKMHAFPCVVPSCGERPSRLHMNRRTDLILHLKDAHKCKLHYARGGPSEKTRYNRVQNKQVREWMNSNG